MISTLCPPHVTSPSSYQSLFPPIPTGVMSMVKWTIPALSAKGPVVPKSTHQSYSLVLAQKNKWTKNKKKEKKKIQNTGNICNQGPYMAQTDLIYV